MIYYPKSHITPNLYSNGDLAYKDTLSPYTGQYFSTYDNKFFSGNYPGDGPNIELLNLSVTSPGLNTTTFEDQNPEDSRFYPQNLEYSLLKKVQYGKDVTPTPNDFFPNPSNNDYETGEFTRYFSKKINEVVYYETSDLFQNNLYIGFSLPWKLTGDKENVYQINKNIVGLKEQQYSVSGLGDYLKHNYLKFYK